MLVFILKQVRYGSNSCHSDHCSLTNVTKYLRNETENQKSKSNLNLKSKIASY